MASPTPTRRRGRPAAASPSAGNEPEPTPAPAPETEPGERSIFDPKWQRWAHRNNNYRDDETISFM